MTDDLTPRQALLVWCLLGRHGSAWQADIRPAVDAKDRSALEARRLVASSKIKGYGGALWLELQDRGWAWAAANLDVGLPPNYRVLQDLLRCLKHHLAGGTTTLADLIGDGADKPPEKARSERASASRAASRLSRAALRKRLEQAFLAVTGGRKDRGAPLGRVRTALGDLDRATVDRALADVLRGDPKARLIRIDDPGAIDAAEADAAFSPAGEPFHILWIES